MALDKFGLIGAGVNFTTSLASGIAQNAQTAAYNKALADTYRTQARLSLASAVRSNMYANKELASNVWDIAEQYNMFSSSQISSLAASGFSMSTGDKRLLAKTESDKLATINAMNEQAYYQSEEMFRQAYLNKIQYDAQAKIADINRKYASGWRGALSATSSAAISALGSYFQFANPSANLSNNLQGTEIGWGKGSSQVSWSDASKYLKRG